MAYAMRRMIDARDETNSYFNGISLDPFKEQSFSLLQDAKSFQELRNQLDIDAAKVYGLGEEREIRNLIERTQIERGPGIQLETILKTPVSNHCLNACRATLSYVIGCVMGRWDFRITKDPSLSFVQQGPFDELPSCPPGMLVSPNGLQATSGKIVSEGWLHGRSRVASFLEEEEVRQLTISDSQYPIDINWEGILVDDPDHPEDMVRRVDSVFRALWQEKAEAVEQEICQILGVKVQREYYRRLGNDGFWMDHIRRYSKGHRKAPIYWLLQSAKRNYALWLYYHRLDKDMLFKALTKYVEPKMRLEESRLEQMQALLASSGPPGREVKQLEHQIERQESLIGELYDFRDKLRRVADLNLEPDLNDGVVLNIAPLWELVPWGEAKKYWEELLAGKYEWSSISKQLRARGVL